MSAAHQTGPTEKLESARASTFTMVAHRWVWPNRIAIGELTLVVGLPDQGKGQLISDVAARVTTGALWPCGEGMAPKGKVVVLSAEDNTNTTIVPRLAAAGADLDQIEIVDVVTKPHFDRMFSLVTDLNLLRQKVLAIGDVKLILIDPISAYLGVRG
jgi:AAA domain